MRDDYAASADLCEEHGFADSAKVLRTVAEGACEAFMVRPEEVYVELGEVAGPLVESTSRARRLFLDREAAERHAADLKASYLREYSPQPYERPYLFKVPEAEFCRHVGAILEINYCLPDDLPAPLIPEGATREQLHEIAPMISAEFFEVVRVPIDLDEEP